MLQSGQDNKLYFAGIKVIKTNLPASKLHRSLSGCSRSGGLGLELADPLCSPSSLLSESRTVQSRRPEARGLEGP